MPGLTEPYLRATVTASSIRARSYQGRPAVPPLMRSMSCRIFADLLLGGDCGCAFPYIGDDGGGPPFPGAQQVVEAGGQVGQEAALNTSRGRADRVRERAAELAAQVIALK
jgi:hypothetical protein